MIMGFLTNLKYSLNKRLSFLKKTRIWSKYGNETRYHFLDDPDISVGEFTYGIPHIKIYDKGVKIKIGKYCSIADNVLIMGGGKHHLEFASTYPFYELHKDIFTNASVYASPNTNDTIIGNDVWIGNGAVILSGNQIGDGAVIGSHAVVSKDIPPYAIAVGNPIRIIKYRFDEETIKRLLASNWWDLAPEVLNELLVYLDNVDEFLNCVKDIKVNN